MDELKIFLGLIEKYGWPAALTAILLYGKFRVWWKKNISKNFTSYEDINEAKEDIRKLKFDLEKLRGKSEMHDLDQATYMETIQGKLKHAENRLDEMAYIIRDVSGGLKTNNRIMGEVKDFLERWEKK